MTKEALNLALEALEELNNTNSYWWQEVDKQTIEKIEPAITAIKEALAQPEHEPVAIADGTFNHNCPVGTPLYTTPPQRKPLTDEQLQFMERGFVAWPKSPTFIEVARAIEAAHGIKG